ncbi:helix-turn-helix domain-containing protein [Myxococcus xanthus]|uniref:helix-turn-helix domain-containing protein n=1 Tax=Myxococcus xanthus TaxID=34 RepID=UPI001F3F5B0C|nr:helix-turn-helix domain-containing protein [Myxococcus xanthus]
MAMIGPLLKEWRTLRGKSQLALSLDAQVSARHLSFLESGRSGASQDLVLRLAEALGLGLRDRNALLVAAGFAPQFGDRGWHSAELAEVRRAAGLILASHEPYPAIVVDSSSTVLEANAGALAMMGQPREALGQVNLMDLVFVPGPVRSAIGNWEEIAGYLLHRLREGARMRGPRSPVAAVLARVLAQPGVEALTALRPANAGSVLVPLTFTRDGTTTHWYTTLTSFGAPQDALVEEITIEQFHPM